MMTGRDGMLLERFCSRIVVISDLPNNMHIPAPRRNSTTTAPPPRPPPLPR